MTEKYKPRVGESIEVTLRGVAIRVDAGPQQRYRVQMAGASFDTGGQSVVKVKKLGPDLPMAPGSLIRGRWPGGNCYNLFLRTRHAGTGMEWVSAQHGACFTPESLAALDIDVEVIYDAGTGR